MSSILGIHGSPSCDHIRVQVQIVSYDNYSSARLNSIIYSPFITATFFAVKTAGMHTDYSQGLLPALWETEL